METEEEEQKYFNPRIHMPIGATGVPVGTAYHKTRRRYWARDMYPGHYTKVAPRALAGLHGLIDNGSDSRLSAQNVGQGWSYGVSRLRTHH